MWKKKKSDWERVIVIWGQKLNSDWVPSRLLLSQHSGYQSLDWASIQNTFNTEDANLPRGGDNGLKDRDHPKVYVAWCVFFFSFFPPILRPGV